MGTIYLSDRYLQIVSHTLCYRANCAIENKSFASKGARPGLTGEAKAKRFTLAYRDRVHHGGGPLCNRQEGMVAETKVVCLRLTQEVNRK